MDAFPGLAKQRGGEGGQLANGWRLVQTVFVTPEQGNVQQGLPVVAVNKEATKGMCCHFLWSTQAGLQKVGFNRLVYIVGLGQVRLSKPSVFCDRTSHEYYQKESKDRGSVYMDVLPCQLDEACIPTLCLLS